MSHIRAAFDLGSSQHKLVVAYVTPGAAPTILFSHSIPVALADALCPSTRLLPPSALRASRLAFARLHALALAHRASAFAAVATAVFRLARNGARHLNSLPVRPVVLDAHDEGVLAFASAMAALPCVSPRERYVVWDSGGASTQWAMQVDDWFHVRAVPLGSSAVRARYRGHKSVDALRDWVAAVAGMPDALMAGRLREGALVLGIGGATSMFALAAERKGGTFGRDDVWEAVAEVERGGEEEVTVLPKLVLLAELMGRYGIERVRHVPGNGNCVGLLASQDDRFWGKTDVVERRDVGVRREDRIFAEGGPKTGVTPSC